MGISKNLSDSANRISFVRPISVARFGDTSSSIAKLGEKSTLVGKFCVRTENYPDIPMYGLIFVDSFHGLRLIFPPKLMTCTTRPLNSLGKVIYAGHTTIHMGFICLFKFIFAILNGI